MIVTSIGHFIDNILNYMNEAIKGEKIEIHTPNKDTLILSSIENIDIEPEDKKLKYTLIYVNNDDVEFIKDYNKREEAYGNMQSQFNNIGKLTIPTTSTFYTISSTEARIRTSTNTYSWKILERIVE